MREILFRGNQVNDGMWIQGYLFQCWGRAYILWGMTNDTPTMHEVIPETVGQFTGLVDRDGERIFEGDILGFAIRHSSKGTVVYDYSGFSFVWDEDTARVKKEIKMEWIPTNVSTMWEVIGNIHDNPELLT